MGHVFVPGIHVHVRASTCVVEDNFSYALTTITVRFHGKLYLMS